MKLRSIELRNLRRFAGQSASITGIGDGISVLSQPNEFGKSTFFDGLYALFFHPHRSRTAPVKALQPHAGGAPEVAVGIELPDGQFRLEKRWLSRPTARVLDAGGRVIAQEDEAEAWIDRLTGQGLAGPSGLLWVRQGLLGMEPEGSSAADRNERERGLSTRRDLLSSVAGEIEMMTGGRRMDQVLARVGEALARLATATLRPKAGGEWARAADEATALAATRAELEGRAERLSGALRQRTSLLREMNTLNDPEAQAREAQSLTLAQAALATAERHAEKTRQAESDLRLAQLTAAQGMAGMARLTDLRDRLSAAEAAAMAGKKTLAELAEATVATSAAEAGAIARHDAAQADARDLAQQVTRAQRSVMARAAGEHARTLTGQLERAGRQRQTLEELHAARSRLKITPALLVTVEKAQALCDRLATQLEARMVAVTLEYQGAVRVLLEGQPLEREGRRLAGPTRLELPGIGTMMIDPGLPAAADASAQLDRARADLANALAAAGSEDATAARQALAQAQRLDQAIGHAIELLGELAPDGLEALRAALAGAQDIARGEETGPPQDLPALERAFDAARTAEEAALSARRSAEGRGAALRERRAAAQAIAHGAQQALAALQAEVPDPVALAAQLLNLAATQQQLTATENEASLALSELRAEAPDLATAKAAVQRLTSAQEGRRQERARLDSSLAGTNGLIGGLADEGIEETLDEVRGREATALARAGRYEREVKALARLRGALEDARREAREAYFGPVLRELDPLLVSLHPGASLQIDDDSLLPVGLTRNGQLEGLDILSGGTREQLAVLTRLAFARLFAAAGQQVPVILDDALVHSDDDRIEAMFTALHRVAQDQQIIVLTCRNRAFASLGGERLQARIEAI